MNVQCDLQNLRELVDGKRVAVVVNGASLVDDKQHLLLKMTNEWGVDVRIAFAPEHGVWGAEQPGGTVESGTDELTGIRICSLFGEGSRRPKPEQLADTDAVVFCLQGCGIRYWTFDATMLYCMQSARERSIPFILVDVPNPIRGDKTEGNVLNPGYGSFLAPYPLPLRHGLTPGEIAAYFNEEYAVGCDLRVVRLRNWKREMWFDQTGLSWNCVTPNLPTINSVLGYGCTGLLQGIANISLGRGTALPFEVVGAPWMEQLLTANELNAQELPGVSFVPFFFAPTRSVFKGETCRGVHINFRDREEVRVSAVALALLETIFRHYQDRLEFKQGFDKRAGTGLLAQLKKKTAAAEILKQWDREAAEFETVRRRNLLY